MHLRSLAFSGVAALAGLGLVGVGAHATFTAQTVSNQQITSGGIDLTLSAANAAGNGTLASPLVLPAVDNVPSSFMSTPELITITNSGSIAASEINLQITNSGSSTLNSEMSMCLYSDSTIVFNGTVAQDEALGNMAVGGTVPAGATDSYTAVFYAGAEPTGCGNVTGYQYGTVDDVGSAPVTTYPVPAAAPDAGTPVGTSNLANTLQNDAENATDSVSITMSYSA